MNWTSTETFLFDTLTWASMIIQCGTILWCMILSIGCQVIYKIQNNRLIENSRVKSNTSYISKEEKGMKTFLYHHKSKRVVVEAAISTAPTLRMNIRRQYQKSSSISVPISQVFSLRRSFYGLTMCFFILILLGNASMATATIVSNSISKSRPSEWYIVLVSIPVLDKVLPLKNIAEELLFRGYRVGFALPENCRHWVMDLDRLEFISLGHLSVKSRSNTITSDNDYPPMDDILSKEGVYESYAASMRYYQSFQRPMFDVLVEDLEEDRPDLVILDRYTFAGFDACHALHIPYIVNSPMLLLDIDTPPAYIPAPFSNFTILTTRIIDRCLNSIYRLRLRVVMVHLFEQVNAVRQEHGLPLIHSKHDLYGDTLILVNSVFGLDDARPIAPQFSMVGRLESARERNNQLFYEALPNEIQTWFTSTQEYMNPIILISFPWTTRLPLEVVTTLMKGLEFVNARVIWKVTLEEVMAVDLGTRQRSSVLFLSGYEDDLLLLNQLPISLLITAGDYTSIQDATSNGVPILGLPWTAEQWEAMNAIVRVGAGLALQSSEFSFSNILDATTLLLSTPSYSRAAFHVGELLKTGGGTKKAVNHIETVLEYGAYHTLPKTNLQPLYKTYLIDVYLVYSAILCGAAVILKTVFSVLYSIFEFAPDVHLGVTLDGSDDENPSNEECTRDVEYNNTSQSQNHRKEKSL